MDGTMGDVARFLMRSELGRRLGVMIDGGNLFGALRELMKNEAARDLLLRVLPDSVKTFAVISALVCIACAVVSAVWEKPGVFLELFAYGYTLTSGILASMESALWGGVLGVVAGALLGALGCKISRSWIIVVPNVVDAIAIFFAMIALAGVSGLLILLCLLLLIAIPVGVYKQFKATATPKDGAARPGAAAPTLKSRWGEWTAKVKAAAARPAESAPGKSPPAGGRKFCPKCGSPLNPGAKFCPKCGHEANG